MHKKIDPTGYGLDEGKAAGLSANYESFFAPLVGKEIKLLELGVHKGASVFFWRDYFENATIVGLDYKPVNIDDPTGRIRVYHGYQQDTDLLDRIAREQAPDGLDVVIDDCSHIGRLARISFWHIFQNHLKPGGIYAIEDWGTGYMKEWPDGRRFRPKSRIASSPKDRLINSLLGRLSVFSPRLASLSTRILISSSIPSHMHSMVGFVKELLDAYYLGEIASPQSGSGKYRHHTISQLHLKRFVVIVVKSSVGQEGQ